MDLRQLRDPYLRPLVARDSLSIEEVHLFQAVDLWATKQCERQAVEVNGELKRRILGEQVIKAIRFPVMRQEEFAAVVLDAKILTPDEIVTFFTFFNLALTSTVGFPETKRSRPDFPETMPAHRCGRFLTVAFASYYYDSGNKDFLAFTVSKDIFLHGVRFFGSENNNYTVTLELMDANRNSCVVSKQEHFLPSGCDLKIQVAIMDLRFCLTLQLT